MQNVIDFFGWLLTALITAVAVSSWLPAVHPALDSAHLFSLELLISLGGGSAIYLSLSRATRVLVTRYGAIKNLRKTQVVRSRKQLQRPAAVF